ncbi:MAG: DUF4333 domain-containing protein [Solirubrobacterales bacterium]|nr:DUF4333 domain-containing protein [Solirubrobacterales bacterium]
MSFLGRSGALAALVAAAIAVAGCGETVLDSAKIEDSIQRDLRRSAGMNVSAVACPSGVEVERGATFTCTVTLAGGEEETAKLRILNEDADIALTGLEPAGKAAEE